MIGPNLVKRDARMQSLLWVAMCLGIIQESLCLGRKDGINTGYDTTNWFTFHVFSAVLTMVGIH